MSFVIGSGVFLYIKEKHLLTLLQIPEKDYEAKQEKLHRKVVREETLFIGLVTQI